MSDLLKEVQTLTEKLEGLRKAMENEIPVSQLASPSDYETLSNFKTALDHVRHLVWPCLLSMEQGCPDEVNYALQIYRMQRVREMIQAIQQLEDAAVDAKTELFLAEVNRLTTRRMD